jgi:beta-mannosidase
MNYFFKFTLLVIILTGLQSTLLSQENLLNKPYYIFPRTLDQHIDLSTDWQLSYTDSQMVDVSKLSKKSAILVSEPTSVHWALNKAGVLPFPYANKNSNLYRWVEEKVWYYQKSVHIPNSASGQVVILSFDGIDYFSKVWVNGQVAGTHEGMFGGPSIDITSQVKYGDKNEIVVEVRAGNWGNKATDFEDIPRNASGERDFSKRTGFNPRSSGKIIKPWVISGGSGTEAFFSLGMWRGARIEILPLFHMERPFLKTLSVANDKAVLHLSSEIFANKNSLQLQLHPWSNAQINHPNEKGTSYIPVKEKLNVRVELLNGKTTAFTKEIPLSINEGRNWLEQDLTIPNPKLWNPVGMGVPELYTVKVSLQKDDKTIDQIQFDYGIRTIERVSTAGPRTADRWENWQFIINGKKIFVKGMNWTPIDVLLDMPESRYRWALEAAKNMGIQLIRVWGGGGIETNSFYKICNELGIMVWQDFPIGNQDTPDFPQDVWESQVVQNIFRLRNHPSLVVWCGGNEFNPYSYGNASTIGILERNLKIFDNTRLFVRTTPDDGSVHMYPDMDPTWYNRSYKYEAWVSETGMHSIPDASLFYELVDKKEFFDLGKMWDKSFEQAHPEFTHHFTEYGPSRVPRMLSRASHIDNMANPTIESISEASQVGAGEWYQVVSEKIQGNYPITAGLMPWVFKRHWPVIAIQMMDWFGQPVAPYYFLKRTYEPTHIAIDLPRLLWKSGETIELKAKVTNAAIAYPGAKFSVTVYDDRFKQMGKEETTADVAEGTSVTNVPFNSYNIPGDYKDRFIFLLAELKDASGKLISRSVYYPRVLSMMDDTAFYYKYLSEPIPWITLDKGPWLKPTVANSKTSLDLKVKGNNPLKDGNSEIQLLVKNTGKTPSFMTTIDVLGAKRIFYTSDNYFWLAPGEEKIISMTLSFRENTLDKKIEVSAKSWNAKVIKVELQSK